MDMLQLYAVPQTEHLKPHIIRQQDGATSVPTWEISRKMDQQKCPSPFGRLVPPYYTIALLPVDLCQEHCLRITSHRTDDMKNRIMDAIMTTYANMLFRARQKLEYRWNFVRTTKSTGNEVF
jgi:hypothetical protein